MHYPLSIETQMKTHGILFLKGFRDLNSFCYWNFPFLCRGIDGLYPHWYPVVLVARIWNFNVLEYPDALGIYKVFTLRFFHWWGGHSGFVLNRKCSSVVSCQFFCGMSSWWAGHTWTCLVECLVWGLDFFFLFENISRMGQSFTCKASSYNLCGKKNYCFVRSILFLMALYVSSKQNI